MRESINYLHCLSPSRRATAREVQEGPRAWALLQMQFLSGTRARIGNAKIINTSITPSLHI